MWFVGLPGSGKTTYSLAIFNALKEISEDARYLSMDERRTAYFPVPDYTEEERTKAYRLFAEEAAIIAAQGTNVIMDGTAPRLYMREYARALVPRFAEIFIRCPLETAINRERVRPDGLVMAGLYDKALKRKEAGIQFEGLGQVIGVDTPFEEDPWAECVINSDLESIAQGRDKVLDFIKNWQ